jgi:hypothetical protein
MQTRSRTVEMPSGLSLPLAFGMNTRLIGSGRGCLLPERKRRFSQPPLDPVRFNVRKILAVDAEIGALCSAG